MLCSRLLLLFLTCSSLVLSFAQVCPLSCAKYGTCNLELSRCDCARHRRGDDCSIVNRTVCGQFGMDLEDCLKVDLTLCLNRCNKWGACISGFCHCLQGYYGTDCSLSLDSDGKPQLLEGLGYTPRPRGPRIYVYELPPKFNAWDFGARSLDRPLYLQFWQRLLSAGVRTVDAETADYYFIPIRARMRQDSRLLRKAVYYIRSHWPWWDRLQGARHLIIHTGDQGRASGGDAETLRLTANVTWLTYWGLWENVPYAFWRASHRPKLDIVVPVYLQESAIITSGLAKTPLHPAAHRINRTGTLFFAGRICGKRSQPLVGVWPNCPSHRLQTHDIYSAGVRQKVHFYQHNRTGFKIVTKSESYGRDFSSHVFCLAPNGAGHGKRNIISAAMGCIPVTVGDKVSQPFQPALNWSEFAVHVPEANIPIMHQILANVSQDRILKMQARLACAAQHLFWSSLYGGIMGEDGRFDAFATTMEILRMKRAYPLSHPREYVRLDSDFKDFMECKGSWTSSEAIMESLKDPKLSLMNGSSSTTSSSSSSSSLTMSMLAKGTSSSSTSVPTSSQPRNITAVPSLCSVHLRDAQMYAEHNALLAAGTVTEEHGASLRLPCTRCLSMFNRELWIPGGAVCCKAQNLATCLP